MKEDELEKLKKESRQNDTALLMIGLILITILVAVFAVTWRMQ